MYLHTYMPPVPTIQYTRRPRGRDAFPRPDYWRGVGVMMAKPDKQPPRDEGEGLMEPPPIV